MKQCGYPDGCDKRATKAIEVDAVNTRFFTCDDHLGILMMEIGLEIYLAEPRVVEL